MKKIVAKMDFTLNGVPYIKGDEMDVKDIDIVKKLNEKGFIEPLEYHDLVLLQRELENKNKKNKEEL